MPNNPNMILVPVINDKRKYNHYQLEPKNCMIINLLNVEL